MLLQRAWYKTHHQINTHNRVVNSFSLPGTEEFLTPAYFDARNYSVPVRGMCKCTNQVYNYMTGVEAMSLGFNNGFHTSDEAPFHISGSHPRTYVRKAGSDVNEVLEAFGPGEDHVPQVPTIVMLFLLLTS